MSIVLFEQQGHIGIITLNRPEVMNAFNFEMLNLLNEFVESIKINPEIRIVLFQASGDKAFSVGADLKERKTLPATISFIGSPQQIIGTRVSLTIAKICPHLLHFINLNSIIYSFRFYFF